ncbi:MAG TPA: cation:proton antiporter [Terriglobales bacterium]|nr:cation:proton antiporter [Terriglobales bacterium]
MAEHSVVFKELSYIFIAAILGGALAWRLRQPLILGYVLAGIAISPYTLGPQVHDTGTFQVVAEVGVIFLMFTIGLEFSIAELMEVKWVALLGGPVGVVLLSLLGAGVGVLLGWGGLRGLVMGMIISVASTMVLSRLLIDSGQLQSPHGKVMVAVTLVEDVIVVVLTILIPVLGNLSPHHLLGVAIALGKAALILVPLGFAAVYIVPRSLERIARSRNQELFLLVILAVCLGTAALTEAVGLSLALGAFAAGLIISASDYAHQTLEKMMPLRDAFVALFFVTVGLLINPRAVLREPLLLLVILALVIVGKFGVWAGVFKLFGYPVRSSVLAATGLTQIGEFSFILLQVAYASGLLNDQFYYATLAASLLSILINASLVRAVPLCFKTHN